jgi:cell migration-inducing and hyaluronan-binding protein
LTPEVPLFGNSVIGARYGTIDIHGQKRTPTWIDLETTAPAGSSSIALNGPVDWKVGEQIVLASTSYELDEAEVRMIDAVGGTAAKPVLTLDAPLAYAHYAGIESCVDPSNVELRGEVGLLTRNIVI